MKIFVWVLIFVSVVIAQSQSQLEELKKLVDDGASEEVLKEKATAMGLTFEDYLKAEEASKNKEAVIKESEGQTDVIVTPKKNQNRNYKVVDFNNRVNANELDAFGYNMFSYAPATFEPSLHVPVPKSYIVGPGDEIVITLWGETQLVHNVTVSKEGDVYIPNVGLVSVNGLSLQEVKQKLFNSLSQVYSSLSKDYDKEGGTRLDVSTGKLRSVKIFVLGETQTPGGYTFPALSTVFTALYYSGGPNINGTLRNIKVIRDGKEIATIDLYEYLLEGKSSSDVNLVDSDVIFIPKVGKRVAITGNVFKPAIYELKEGENLGDLLNYSKGLDNTAYFERVSVERVLPFAQRKSEQKNIINLDLTFDSREDLLSSQFKLYDGDVVTIRGINLEPRNRVSISGLVYKPGVYELVNSSMTIKDLINAADGLRDEAFFETAFLIRTLPTEKKEIYKFNIEKALEGDPEHNLYLENRDEVRIFQLEDFFPTRSVEISGAVKNPGFYSRSKYLTVSDLIVLAGGLTEFATTKDIEITRIDSTSIEVLSTKFNIDLPKDYWNLPAEDEFLLRDYDRVLIKTDPNLEPQRKVQISGEVNYPGSYSLLNKNDKVYNLLNRAGGFTSSAYLKGIYLERDDPQVLSSARVKIPDSLLFRNQIDYMFDTDLLNRYSARIPIEWEEISRDTNSVYNIQLKPDDRIVVPEDPKVVKVLGDVGIPSNVPFREGKSVSYYIEQAGGYTATSARGKEIVIQANGRKLEESGWFFIPDESVESGGVIIVPSEIEYKSDAWPLIRDIVSIVSSTAVLILTVINLTN